MEASTSTLTTRATATAGRMVRTAFAGIGGLVGLALLIGGIAVLAAYVSERDEEGYVNSDPKQLESDAYAITTQDIDLGVDEVDWAPDEALGDLRVRVEGQDPAFVGIASDEDVERYLGRVAHDELIDLDGAEPELDPRHGGAPRTPPGEQDFWVATSEGPGEQALTWDAEFGRWTAVVMNADAARGIDVEADAGVKLDWAIWAGLGMLLFGLLMTVGAAAVIGGRGGRHSRTG